MPSEVLIAYCSRSGSTREVAETIGRTMSRIGLTSIVQSIDEVESVPEGAAVLLGTALYVGHFPREFHRFLEMFQARLAKVRPWVFVLGPTEKERRQFALAEEQAHKELGKHSWLHLSDMRILGGKFDPQNLHLPFPLNLAMKLPANPMKKMPATDIRDWEWIERWATAIAETLASKI